MDKVKIFIGIDQTGAINAKGIPKPLNVSIIDMRSTVRHITGLLIPCLRLASIQKLLQDHISAIKQHKVLICVDTVFGLPKYLGISTKILFAKAAGYSYMNKDHGAVTAYNFYQQFLDSKKIPQRKIELLVQANSVFNLQPFQKNIGCGSFRIIKDLAQDPKWFSLWPFDRLDKQYLIAEGYPSYFWRNYLGCSHRDLVYLASRFKQLKFRPGG